MERAQRWPEGGEAATRRAVFAEIDWTIDSVADEVVALGPGRAVRTRSLPQVFWLNVVILEQVLAPEQVVALAEAEQGDLPYRHVCLDDGEGAAALAEAMKAAGWTVEREVAMVLVAEPDRIEVSAAVVELAEAEVEALHRRWLVEEKIDSPETIAELREASRREGALWNERRLGVRDETGAAASMTKFRRRGGTGWIEDVYTTPESRGRAYARSLVTHAIGLARAEGCETTFISADDLDSPKQLYAKLGFHPVGLRWFFHLADAAR